MFARTNEARKIFAVMLLWAVVGGWSTATDAQATLVSANVPVGWGQSKQSLTFYNGQNYFLVYSDNTVNLRYKSSSDNVTWSAEQTLVTDYLNAFNTFDIYLVDDDTFDLIYPRSSDTFTVVKSCAIAGQTITADAGSTPVAEGWFGVSVARSPSNDRLFAAGRIGGGALRVYSADQTGNAAGVSSWTGEVTTGDSYVSGHTKLTPYGSVDRVLAIYQRNPGGANSDGIYSRAVTRGGGAGTSVEIGNLDAVGVLSNAVRVSDTEFHYILSNSGTAPAEFVWDGASWTGPTSFANASTESPCLLYDATNDDLYAFAVDVGTDDVMRYLKPSGGGWDAGTIVDDGEAALHTLPVTQMHEPPSGSGRAADEIVWAYQVANGGNFDLHVSALDVGSPADSDGDGLWDYQEDLNADADNDPATNPAPNTDGDGFANYLDADDDDDGTATASEDADPNGDGDPRDAVDGDRDGQADYLDDPTGASSGIVDAEQKISDLAGGFTAPLLDFDQFGRSVTAIGDLDGDGVNDLAVGAYGDDDGGSARGAAYILFMNSNGSVGAQQKISDTQGGLVASLADNDWFGMAVAGIGDLDGDGLGDLAVGALQDGDGGTARGAVYILFLAADGTVKEEQKISALQGGLTGPLDDNDRFGNAVSGLGDLDGDGVVDIAVGAVADGDGGPSRGAVYVLLLNPDGTVKAETKISSTQGGLTGPLDDLDRFGCAVSGIGDLDSDGVNDMVVGAFADGDGGAGRGAVYVLLLNATGTVKAEQKISDTQGGFNTPLDDNDGFGDAVSGVGDVDDDGVADMVVGAGNDDDDGNARGAAYVLFLNTNGSVAAEQKISDLAGGFTTTLTDLDQFGSAVTGIGDLDGDGRIDLAIGTPGDDDGGDAHGAVYILNLAGPNSPPTADAGGPYAVAEGDDLLLDGSGSSDPDLDSLTYLWDLDNDLIYGDETGVSPTVSWAALQGYGYLDNGGPHTIGLQVDDGVNPPVTDTAELTITNAPPTITLTGTGTADPTVPYTLNLSVSDPGPDTVTDWVINWGDGDIQTINGNPASVDHPYDRGGFTYNITAAAIDEDGTWHSGRMVVPGIFASNQLFRLEASTGAIVDNIGSGLGTSLAAIVGPDGMLYVGSYGGDRVHRFNPVTGSHLGIWIPSGSGGLDGPSGMAFGPDGHFYVGSNFSDEVLRFHGTTGAPLGALVTANSGGLDEPDDITFGPTGDLYVTSFRTHQVLRYDGLTGEPKGIFAQSPELSQPSELVFGPDGHLYVTSVGNDQVVKYNGSNGNYMEVFATPDGTGLDQPRGAVFGPDGNLYVSGRNRIVRYNGTNGDLIDVYLPSGTINGPCQSAFVPGHQVAVTSPTATVSGRVFEDADFAGTASAWDGGVNDAPQPNVDVEVYDVADTYLGSTTTAGDGSFSFGGLPIGAYKVRARASTLGDADTPPAGGLNGTVPGTWFYPLAEMTWAGTAALIGGQDALVDDADTGDNLGPGDNWVIVGINGVDVADVNLGFAYNLIVNTADDSADDATRSGQGSLRQFIKNANAIGTAGGTTANTSQFYMQTATNQSDGGDGWWRITAAAELPSFQDSGTSLDGSSQRINGGANPNTRGPEIEIHGNGVAGSGLDIQGTVVIREVVVNDFASDGIHLSGAAASGSGVYACYIGTNAVGTSPLGNGDSGIEITTGASSSNIGGVGAEGNVISGNTDDGVLIDPAATGTTLMGNMIGTNATGTAPIGNGGSGGDIQGSGNTIGGSGAGEGNVICANGFNGLVLSGDANTVEGNHIGVDAAGTAGFGNGQMGIWILASNCVVGGTDPGAGNVISGNGKGLRIEGPGATLNTVQGNIIGLNAAGTAPIKNNGEGVEINSAPDNTIGGATAAARNVISGNDSRGVDITVATATGNKIQGNYIGLNSAGDMVIANVGPGVKIWQGATENLVGGINGGEGNVIVGNAQGVVIADLATVDNPIIGNSIHANSGFGIDLAENGLTDNDADDDDSGPNDLLNFPEITSATESGGTVIVNFDLDVEVGDHRIEFFKNPSGVDATYGEGEVFASAVSINHGGAGVESFSHSFPGAAGDVLTATSTEDLGASHGSTSEFSAWFTVTGAPTYEISGTVFEDTDFAGTATDWDGGTSDVALANVDVELYDNSDVYQTSVTTDGSGSFTFTGLADGTFKVRVRSWTLGDSDTSPAGGLHPTVPATWPYPLAEMTWGHDSALIGGQDHSVDDTATGDNAGPGDTYVVIAVSGADLTGVNFGFNYDLITNTDDDANLDSARSKQGCFRQFIKNSNAIVGVNKSWFQTLSP